MNMKQSKKASFAGFKVSIKGNAFSFDCRKNQRAIFPLIVINFFQSKAYISEVIESCKRLVTDLMSVAKATTDTNRRHLKTFDYESIIGELAYDHS